MRDYWDENTSLDIFNFSVSIYRTRISADKFSREPLFHHFYLKNDANAHDNFVFSNTGWFNRKTENTVRFSIVKIRLSIIFMHLRSKLTSEICQKIGGLNGKTEQNRPEVPALPPFFFKKKPTVFIEKRKALIDFLL